MNKFDFKLPKKNKKLWVKALRSGKYIQGTGALKIAILNGVTNHKFKYCCLGVAVECKLTRPGRRKFSGFTSSTFVSKKFLPEKIQNFLASRNDGISLGDELYLGPRWSFKKIANWIEKNL